MKKKKAPRVSILRKTFRAADGCEKSVTIQRLQGAQPGPCLALIAGQHGMEHMGPVVLQRFLDAPPEDFRGTLYLCPCANPFALEQDFEWYPENEGTAKLAEYYYSRFRHDYCPYGIGRNTPYNMNRMWNRRGRKNNGLTGAITTWIWDTACAPADLIIDFHGRMAERPLVYARGEAILPYARYFGAQGIFLTMTDTDPESFAGGNLAIQGNLDGKRAFCLEFSCQHGYKQEEVPFGLNGIINTMQGIGMLEGAVILERPVYHVHGRVPVAATASGHIHYEREPYDPVKQGDLLFTVRSMETLEVVARGAAPADGLMSERSYHPVARPGLALCSVLQAEPVAPAGQPLEHTPL